MLCRFGVLIPACLAVLWLWIGTLFVCFLTPGKNFILLVKPQISDSAHFSNLTLEEECGEKFWHDSDPLSDSQRLEFTSTYVECIRILFIAVLFIRKRLAVFLMVQLYLHKVCCVFMHKLYCIVLMCNIFSDRWSRNTLTYTLIKM